MPLYREFSDAENAILVWQYQAEVEAEQIDLDTALSKKKIEKWMISQMLQSALPNHLLKHQDHGAPYVEPHSADISISHAYPYAVLAIAPQPIGVDIELKSEKIRRVKSKFLSKKEMEWLADTDDLNSLTSIWCIKESLYKIHQEKYWSFRTHYEVSPFRAGETAQAIACRVVDTEGNATAYQAQLYHLDGDYILAVVTAV
ncbi:4'-phosphopantetheinyl transferase family protein [Riemerella columbina]|uniref:4'-phosphopantetheinyl transferase family protein n=1 Tax=Riemerella columbina TaxID=103810 RepID=UPI00266FC861|nr:4'-phosphopantetheinyl transferase family protein [Riemerella columbina]WKS94312.1 4'-phosphopantetheinyl transferase superfamily protein [Riemerella columbina]